MIFTSKKILIPTTVLGGILVFAAGMLLADRMIDSSSRSLPNTQSLSLNKDAKGKTKEAEIRLQTSTDINNFIYSKTYNFPRNYGEDAFKLINGEGDNSTCHFTLEKISNISDIGNNQQGIAITLVETGLNHGNTPSFFLVLLPISPEITINSALPISHDRETIALSIEKNKVNIKMKVLNKNDAMGCPSGIAECSYGIKTVNDSVELSDTTDYIVDSKINKPTYGKLKDSDISKFNIIINMLLELQIQSVPGAINAKPGTSRAEYILAPPGMLMFNYKWINGSDGNLKRESGVVDLKYVTISIKPESNQITYINIHDLSNAGIYMEDEQGRKEFGIKDYRLFYHGPADSPKLNALLRKIEECQLSIR